MRQLEQHELEDQIVTFRHFEFRWLLRNSTGNYFWMIMCIYVYVHAAYFSLSAVYMFNMLNKLRNTSNFEVSQFVLHLGLYISVIYCPPGRQSYVIGIIPSGKTFWSDNLERH